MNADAQEAALGLLGLNHLSPQPPPSLIVPQKRKQSHSSSADGTPPPPPPQQLHLPPTLTIDTTNQDSINCICGYTFDDGFSIACDDCGRWCHAACFDIVEGGIPEEWRCWVCVPRGVDVQKAVDVQRARMEAARLENGSGHGAGKRRVSPGVERKQRRPMSAIEGGKRRHRRTSIHYPVHSLPPPPPTPPAPTEEEHIDIVTDPSTPLTTTSYTPLTTNHIPDPAIRANLRRQAQHWRGLTALQQPHPPESAHPLSSNTTPVLLNTPPPSASTSTTIHPLQPPPIPHSTPGILPPSYTLHTTQPIPSSSFISPYTSTLTPSSTYLSDPLNAYAGLGLPKPYVHLFGPPLDIAVDARQSGSQSRFVRNGCHPNAVLRPVICRNNHAQHRSKAPGENGKRTGKGKEKAINPEDESDTGLEFALFALKDLKAGEEVVLAWEWDDNHAIHQLPAVIQSPHMFPPQHIHHLRNQMTHILHALGSTFTTCACGGKAEECAVSMMGRFVERGVEGLNFGVGLGLGLGLGGGGMDWEGERGRKVDLGPLVGVERGFKTRERVRGSGGLSGVEIVREDGEMGMGEGEGMQVPRVTVTSPSPRKGVRDVKGKGRAVDSDGEEGDVIVIDDDENGSLKPHPQPRRRRQRRPPSSLSPSLGDDDATDEKQMPPKMRKRWIHDSFEALKRAKVAVETEPGEGMGMDMDDERPRQTPTMPPPPLPASLDPTTVTSSSTSRSRSPPIFSSLPWGIRDRESKSPASTSPPYEQPPASMTLSFESHRLSPLTDLQHNRHSPSMDFARLSLVSPVLPSTSGVTDGPFSPQLLSGPSLSDPPRSDWLPTRRPGSPPATVSDSPTITTTFPSSSQMQPSTETPASQLLPQEDSAAPPPANDRCSPTPPPLPPPPQSPSPPKVKLSLKDFALRKKRQKEEEEMTKSMSVDVETVSPRPNGDIGMEVDGKTDGKENVGDMSEDLQGREEDGMTVGGQTSVNGVSADHQRTYDKTESQPPPHHSSSPTTTHPPSSSMYPLQNGQQSGSLEAKFEMIDDDAIPSGLVGPDDGRDESIPPSPPALPHPSNGISDRGEQDSGNGSQRGSLAPSQEEGEISNSSSTKTSPKMHSASFLPRVHTPPTQPRSFGTSSVTGSPGFISTAPSPSTATATTHRRHPSYTPPAYPRRSLPDAGLTSSSGRPLPSGPRALRALSQASTYPSPSRTLPGPVPQSFLPRGPSADRDRDRERDGRDRDRVWPPGSRSWRR